MDTVRFGDLKAWIAQGRLDSNSVTDFLAVLRNGAATATSSRTRLFVSTGSALFDNLTLGYLLRNDTSGAESTNQPLK
jgi:ornithine cyclodeaminase/alanine dehydrogenase-like protein (mu-crystallin family)